MRTLAVLPLRCAAAALAVVADLVLGHSEPMGDVPDTTPTTPPPC